MCLAHFLASLRRRQGFSLALLHVHHGLRGREADRDLDFVLALGKALDAPVSAMKVAVIARAQARGKGVEDAARELRYDALKKPAAMLGCGKGATGHHLDDHA